MEPAIRTGSVVIIQPAKSYDIGDVITFRQASTDPKSTGTITHRIIKKQQVNGTDIFQTMGDANNAADILPVTSGNILGKTRATIPFLGYVLEFLRNPIGLILFVIIPSTLIISEEAKKIRREAARLYAERKARKAASTEPEPTPEPTPESQPSEVVEVATQTHTPSAPATAPKKAQPKSPKKAQPSKKKPSAVKKKAARTSKQPLS